MRILTPIAITTVAALVLAGCTNPDGTRNNTQTGVATGAILGGLAGNLISDSRGGAVIGAVAGGALGAAIGNDLDRQAQELRGDLTGTGAEVINQGGQLTVSLPEQITFAVGSAALRPSIRSNLFAVAANLQRYPNSSVQVIGHTDNTGGEDFNLNLSRERAAAVANVLLQGGVPSSRLITVGLGETSPIAPNSTEFGRQRNRRVEILIIPTG